MYIIELTYEKNLDEVEKYLSEHKIFLDKMDCIMKCDT